MMNRIRLNYNAGNQWFGDDKIHVKGYLFDPEGNYFSDAGLLEYFKPVVNFSGFRDKVAAANGMFSVVLLKGIEIWLAVDSIRRFPLFYTSISGGWQVSDDAEYLAARTEKKEINPEASLEFLAAGYVTGDETLVKDVFQVQAGELIRLTPGSWDKTFYYSYTVNQDIPGSYSQFKSGGKEIFDRAFTRLVKSLENRTAVIPLSGGYDSRLIAVMLRRFGYEKVICFTYGRRSSPEIEISKKVADKLSFPWIFIEYNDQLISGFTASDEFKEYYPYGSQLVSMFYLQEYFAVRYLKENRLIPDDSIIIPGHSGDFLGGSQFLKHDNLKKIESPKIIARRLYRVKYIFKKPGLNGQIRLQRRILKSLDDKKVIDSAFAYSIHEDWDFKEKLAKFNFNSASIYDFFGYGCRLPYWDLELLSFFRSLPLEYKLGKVLYNDILNNDYFREYELVFQSELQTTPEQLSRMKRRSRIKKLIPQFIKRLFLNKDDQLYYREITDLLCKDMLNRGRKIRIFENSYNSLIIQWYLEDLKEKLQSGLKL